jgi:hypothetical protein
MHGMPNRVGNSAGRDDWFGPTYGDEGDLGDPISFADVGAAMQDDSVCAAAWLACRLARLLRSAQVAPARITGLPCPVLILDCKRSNFVANGVLSTVTTLAFGSPARIRVATAMIYFSYHTAAVGIYLYYAGAGGLGLLCAPCVGLGFLFWLRFALRSFALWRVFAIAPSFVYSWRAFSSVSLSVTSIYTTNLRIRIRAALPAGIVAGCPQLYNLGPEGRSRLWPAVNSGPIRAVATAGWSGLAKAHL